MEFSEDYTIESDILNASDYGVAQNRLRAIIKIYKKIWFGSGLKSKKENIC